MTDQQQTWMGESQKYLANIYANVGIGIARVSPEGYYKQVNPMMCQYLGYSESEMLKMHFLDITHPDDRPDAAKKREDLVSDVTKSTSFEKRHIHKEGHVVWAQVTVIPVLDSSGRLEYFVSAHENVTDRKLSEQLLRHQNDVLQLMAMNRPLPETLARIVRLIEEQAPGCTSTIYLVREGRIWLGAAPSFPASFVEAVNGAPIGPQAGSCGAAAFLRKRVVSTDVNVDDCWGPYRDWFKGYGYGAAWSTPVLAKDGEVIGTVSMCWKTPKDPTPRHFELADVATKLMGIAIERDLNERLMREQQLKMLASSKLAALGEMAGGLAHEINNPLAIISGRSDQLRLATENKKLTPEFAGEISESIQRTTVRISKIIKGLKAFARDGEHEEVQEVRLLAVIEDTLSFCRQRFRHHSVELLVECPEELRLQCRPVQLSQLLLNLLNNSHDALEALPERWIRIEARESDGHVLLSVTDSGPGIPEAIRAKILQPFFTTKEPNRGTGLGLSICNSIVESHGGSFQIDSAAANTRFLVTLPKTQKASS